MVAAFYAVSGVDPAVEPTINCEPGSELPGSRPPAAQAGKTAAV